MKKEPLKYAHKIAKEDGYTTLVKDRGGKRVDNIDGFKWKDYVFISVSKVNYDKARIVVNADTKKHIEQLEKEAQRKKEEAKRKAAEEAKRKKREKEKKARDAWLNETVYITKTGNHYQLDGCSMLRSRIAISRRAARARGLVACTKCRPDFGHYDW